MDKTKPDQALSGKPLAKKIVAEMRLHWQRKVVNIKNVIVGHAMAEELQKTVVIQKDLEGFHPSHATYVYAQNPVSVMSEQLTALKEMAPFVDIISRAKEPVCAKHAADEPVDHILLHLLGIFRSLCGTGQRDRRHHHFGSRHRLRHAPRGVARETGTPRLSQFWGIKQKGRLAAMASERMKHIGHSEISGVCAHPDFRGRGFARALSAAVAQEIIARGEVPYLHSYSENTSAIRPYESLRVQIRCEMHAAVLTRL